MIQIPPPPPAPSSTPDRAPSHAILALKRRPHMDAGVAASRRSSFPAPRLALALACIFTNMQLSVGTGTIAAKPEIKKLQSGIRAHAGPKIVVGHVIKVEAHPIQEHPRACRVVGCLALVGDAAGYVTRCSGEGIYFAAKSRQLCEQVMAKERRLKSAMTEAGIRRGYLRRWDDEFVLTFRIMDLLKRLFYDENTGREALVVGWGGRSTATCTSGWRPMSRGPISSWCGALQAAWCDETSSARRSSGFGSSSCCGLRKIPSPLFLQAMGTAHTVLNNEVNHH